MDEVYEFCGIKIKLDPAMPYDRIRVVNPVTREFTDFLVPLTHPVDDGGG